MKIHARYSNVLFGGMLSLIMVSIISCVVVIATHGLSADFPSHWLKGFATAWPVAFPTVLVVAPLVRKIVVKLTDASPGETISRR